MNNFLETRNENYNDMQEISSAISGYDHFSDFTSARDDYYYECKNTDEKLKQIKVYADAVYNINLSQKEVLDVHKFLEEEKDMTQDERWHAFDELK